MSVGVEHSKHVHFGDLLKHFQQESHTDQKRKPGRSVCRNEQRAEQYQTDQAVGQNDELTHRKDGADACDQ